MLSSLLLPAILIATPPAARNASRAQSPPPVAQPVPETPAPPAPIQGQCVQNDGDITCGFHCVSQGTVAKCARTPLGSCLNEQGQMTCWDPPVFLALLPEQQPRSRCVRQGANVACGYNCLVRDGEVACATTPFGSCAMNFGTISCWDPSEATIRALRGVLPAAQCIQFNDQLACGYACIKADNKPMCAGTPWGTCTNVLDKARCVDPDLPPP
jgi:hypothetical protein